MTLLAFLAAPAMRAAKSEPRIEGRFEGSAQVVEVQVPVNVVDRNGEPLRELTAADFIILDQGKEREITGFRKVDLDLLDPATTQKQAETLIPAAARRHFLFLFDVSFSQSTSVYRARQAAREFVVNSLHPTDLAAVAIHGIESGPRLLITFTPDRAQLARAIDTLGAMQMAHLSRRDPLRFLVEDPLSESGLASSDINQAGAGDVAATLRQSVIASIRVIGKQIEKTEKSFQRGRISSWSRSMQQVATLLRSVQGRKQVVYFSEGFDGRLMLGRRPSGQDREQQQDFTNLQLGNYWMVDTDDIYGNTSLQADVQVMLEEFRRADAVIQAVDISGLRADEPRRERIHSVGQDALFFMAHSTGGELYEDANNFGHELERVLNRSTVTYLLTFQAGDIPVDGAYHRIKVKLAEAPKGVRVSYRRGYYAPRPFKDLHPIERNLLASDAIAAAAPRRDIPLQVLAAPFHAGQGAAYVPVIVEVEGAALLAGQTGVSLPVEIYAYVTDSKGEMRDFFTQLVTLDVSRSREGLRRTGLKYYGHLELGPGDYLVRVLVRNAATGRTGVETIPLSIPAFAERQRALLPPFFLEAPGQWLLVREKTESYQKSVVYPFTVNGEPYIPAAAPRLKPGEPASLCLVGYNLGAGELVVNGRVLASDGQVLDTSGRLDLVERTVTGIEGLDKLLATFRPENLESGSYTLQVAVSDPATGATETNSIRFTIPN